MALFPFIVRNREFGLFVFCTLCRPYFSPILMILFMLEFKTNHTFNTGRRIFDLLERDFTPQRLSAQAPEPDKLDLNPSQPCFNLFDLKASHLLKSRFSYL